MLSVCAFDVRPLWIRYVTNWHILNTLSNNIRIESNESCGTILFFDTMSDRFEIPGFVRMFYCIASAVSCFSNALLIFIIATKSPKHVGAYKYLMIFISIFEILYSILDVLLLPVSFQNVINQLKCI